MLTSCSLSVVVVSVCVSVCVSETSSTSDSQSICQSVKAVCVCDITTSSHCCQTSSSWLSFIRHTDRWHIRHCGTSTLNVSHHHHHHHQLMIRLWACYINASLLLMSSLYMVYSSCQLMQKLPVSCHSLGGSCGRGERQVFSRGPWPPCRPPHVELPLCEVVAETRDMVKVYVSTLDSIIHGDMTWWHDIANNVSSHLLRWSLSALCIVML